MEQDLISIIIPCYNASRYLNDVFLSIKNQTYQNLEVIFVDDGSTDETGKMLDNFALSDSRIKVIHKPNGGVNSSRNVALLKAKGAFLYFLDADDIIANNAIEILHNFIKKYNVDVAFGNTRRIRENRKINFKNNSKIKKVIYLGNADAAFADILSTPVGGDNIWGKLYKRDSLEKLENYPNIFNENCTYAEDLLFCISYFQQIEKAVRVNADLYFYRQVKNSAIHSKFTEKYLSAFLVFDANEKIDQNKFPTSKRYSSARICLVAMDLIDKLARSDYHNPDAAARIYNCYKNNLKKFFSLSKLPFLYRFGTPLTRPFMYLMIRKKLKG